jgi:hypothetical protein
VKRQTITMMWKSRMRATMMITTVYFNIRFSSIRVIDTMQADDDEESTTDETNSQHSTNSSSSYFILYCKQFNLILKKAKSRAEINLHRPNSQKKNVKVVVLE